MILLLVIAALNFHTCGQGDPVIVIHGGPGLTQDYLLPHLNRLCEDHFVIFYDQGERETLEGFMNDLETLRTNFKYEKVSLLGHSWGGYLAMQYAIAHPDRVEKLVLANSEPANFEGYTSFGEEWMRRIAPYKEQIEVLEKKESYAEGDADLHEQCLRMYFRIYCYNPSDVDKLNLRLSPQANKNLDRILPLVSKEYLQKPYNLCEGLKNLRIPTLIIHGKQDVIPQATAETIHSCIPNSKLVIIDQCGHFPYVEQPDVFFQSLKDFLRR